jgi:hypothetical protein
MSGTKDKPWKLKTPPGTSDYEAYVAGDTLVVTPLSCSLVEQTRPLRLV